MSETEQESFARINEALVRAVPELRGKYAEETDAWGEEMGPHVIYGDVLNPYLTDLLQAGDDPTAEEALGRIFAFLERMLGDPDPEVSNVAATTVAEHLESDPHLERARLFMGPMMTEATRARPPFVPPRSVENHGFGRR